MSNFIAERTKKCINGISKYLDILPDYFIDYFIAIENYTSPLTRLNYAQDMTTFFEYLQDTFKKPSKSINYEDLNKLKKIDFEMFLSYISYYTKNGKVYTNGEKGKARKIASIRSFFKFLYNNDKITSDVASKIDTPKIHTKEIIRLDVDEVAKLINEAETPDGLTKMQIAFNKHTKIRDVAILTLFLGTGIRVSECVGLNIKDIDFNNNAFKITRKGGNNVVLYFGEEVRTALINWLNERNQFVDDKKEDALFLSLQKKRITTRAVENIVKKYSKIASPLKKISPHKLRSTYGTNLYRETGDIYIVAEVLGHKDVNTTKKHYAAISEDIRRSVADKVKLRD